MTVVFETWQDKNNINLFADIEQDKYCKSYKLVIYEYITDIDCRSWLTRVYMSKQSARQAMRKYGEFIKISDISDNNKGGK